jgi:hypothetical protein
VKTIAVQLGQTPHLSPLLRRLRRQGFSDPDQLRRLAVVRGCAHYRNIDDSSYPPDPGQEVVSDAELAVAMVSGAQEFDPLLIRCAAQLLSGDFVKAEAITRLAVQERAVQVIRHIAKAGEAMDIENACKWRHLLTLLPAGPEVPEGKLPHGTRFVSQIGLQRIDGRLERVSRSIWLRPTARKCGVT